MIYVHHMCNMLHVCIYAQTIPNKSQDKAQTIQTLVINVCIPNQGHKSQMRKQIADLRGDFAYTKNSCNIVYAHSIHFLVFVTDSISGEKSTIWKKYY